MQYTTEYWNKRFEASSPVPKKVKQAIMKAYSAYPAECMPQGLCDPMYIMNVICHELGIGDGQGKFYFPDQTGDIPEDYDNG